MSRYIKILLSVFALLILSAVIVVLLVGREKSEQGVGSNNSSLDQVSSDQETVYTDKDKQDANSQPIPEKDPEYKPPEPLPQELGVTITRASQVSDSIQIRAIISGTESGNCDVRITKPGSSDITKKSPITNISGQMSCTPINIPLAEFQEGGSWDVVVTVSNGSSSGSATQTVSISK